MRPPVLEDGRRSFVSRQKRESSAKVNVTVRLVLNRADLGGALYLQMVETTTLVLLVSMCQIPMLL